VKFEAIAAVTVKIGSSVLWDAVVVFDTRATSDFFSFIPMLFHDVEALFLSLFLTFPFKFFSFISSSFIVTWFYLYFNIGPG
jgi:hypothetical protein